MNKCIECGKEMNMRGFCSQTCHDNYYDDYVKYMDKVLPKKEAQMNDKEKTEIIEKGIDKLFSLVRPMPGPGTLNTRIIDYVCWLVKLCEEAHREDVMNGVDYTSKLGIEAIKQERESHKKELEELNIERNRLSEQLKYWKDVAKHNADMVEINLNEERKAQQQRIDDIERIVDRCMPDYSDCSDNRLMGMYDVCNRIKKELKSLKEAKG